MVVKQAGDGAAACHQGCKIQLPAGVLADFTPRCARRDLPVFYSPPEDPGYRSAGRAAGLTWAPVPAYPGSWQVKAEPFPPAFPLLPTELDSRGHWQPLFGLEYNPPVHLQVFLGVGLALLCLSILLGCTMCWQLCRRPGPRLGWKWVTVELGPALPTGTVPVPVQRPYEEVAGEVLGAWVEEGPPASPASRGGLLHDRASLPSLPFPPKPVGARTTSGANLLRKEEGLLVHPILGPLSPLPSGTSPKQRPRLHCHLFYSPAEATLTVTVLSITHLPRGGRGSYVKVYLLPRLPASRRVALQRGSLHPARREPCRFGRYSLEELRNFTLRFAVYTRFHSFKDSFMGEVLFPCAQATWDTWASCSYSWELSSTKTKLRKCLSAHDTSHSVLSSPPKSLGHLFLLLQYQALAGRIKVLVRKAEHLGRLSRMPGTPGHYVIIHLHHNGHVIDTKETKSITGYNPVWNTPFLFNLPAGDIQQQDLFLEFTVMQARIYTRSSPLGQVQVGPRAPGAGLLHWREMCSQGPLESARWHRIQPDALGP
ncbi:synaptotagmin-5-like [Chlamydotis macqueenii]